MSVLEIKNLYVHYQQENTIDAVHNVSFSVEKGESIGIIGESGSGKSTLALSIMGLLNNNVEIKGSIHYKGQDILKLTEKELQSIRWRKIAIVFQNSLDVLNPVITVGYQLVEAIIRHTTLNKKYATVKAKTLLSMVGLEDSWFDAFAHQLSGGMRQRVLIAMALSCDPEILIADEPTMALDSVTKEEIVELIKNLQKEKQFSLIVISHELPVIASLADRAMVMYLGNVMETGKTKEILTNPMHPYTRGLIYSSPVLNPIRDMWGISGEVYIEKENQCPFYSRCNQRIDDCLKNNPQLQNVSQSRKVSCIRGGIVTILKADKINKRYSIKNCEINACSHCDVHIRSGEVVALIGETGSGKTSLAQILGGIITADEGQVMFEGRKVDGNSETKKKNGIQIVFQDPLSATNEHFTIGKIVQEPLDIIKSGTKEERVEEVKSALSKVQLPYDDNFLNRKGHTLSGGQRQRVAIARALVMNPKLMIADEISSMLDPSNAANMLRLLKGLQNTQGFSMLYITHDIAIAEKISDKVYVMKNGRIIEKGIASEVFSNPKESYTKMLLKGMKGIVFK
ncbi:MAG: ABC transporter ATP-binding protein [Lachnospiraceae bacterium]|nr:ABC transporter ATP-binding protein [Lachnospiraceae bacterium]